MITQPTRDFVRRGRLLVAGGVVALVACSCSGSQRSGGGASTGPTGPEPSATTRPATTPTSTVSGPDVATLIAESVPSGYAIVPDDVADTGPADLNKATEDDFAANGAAVLRQAGFVRGYERTWTARGAADDNTLIVHQFATPAGAELYVMHWYELLQVAGQGQTVTTFPVMFPSPAYGVRSSDDASSTAVVVFAKGPYAVQAIVHGGPNRDESGAVTTLATAQRDRLP